MDVANRSAYYNSIYSAVVVNANSNEDPESRGRVQIYIPSVHLQYSDIYLDYMQSEDKASHDGWSKFPWATTIVEGLENGSVVFGNYIDNENNKYIIIGKDVNNSVLGIETSQSYSATMSGTSSGILLVTIPIILQNEIGIATTDWPDGISDAQYGKITPYDNGGWSVGLLQWHHSRAFDCMYEIAKNYTNWIECFTSTNLDFVRDLQSSLTACSPAAYRTKYQASFHPTPDTVLYNGIYRMLVSDMGKKTQQNIAKLDTLETINMLMADPYNLTNPAIIIFLTDLVNQYGPGLPNTLKEAAKVNKKSTDMMSQLDEVVAICKANIGTYNKYVTRRDRVYAYIKELHNRGKLNDGTILDMTATNENVVTGTGMYSHPCPTISRITAPYGKYPSGGKHYGVDFGCPLGTKIYACTSGVVEHHVKVGYNTYPDKSGSYGKYIKLKADDGNTIYYAHLSNFNGNSGRKVLKGDLIGYTGNTGNSSGPHLHFEIRKPGGLYPWNTTDPIPFIGG